MRVGGRWSPSKQKKKKWVIEFTNSLSWFVIQEREARQRHGP